jgi:phosphotransacetylase
MTSSSHAEKLFKECIQLYSQSIGAPNVIQFSSTVEVEELLLKAQSELVTFYLKEERIEEAYHLLTELIKEKNEFYGDFNIKLNSDQKLLCSILLKKNDMPNATRHLQKSYQIEKLNYGVNNKKTLKTLETLQNFKKYNLFNLTNL